MEEPNCALCEGCHRRVPAEQVVHDGKVYLRKHCSRCGDCETLITLNAELYEWCHNFKRHLQHINMHNIRSFVCGVSKQVTLTDGTRRPYVNFDNAATTPPIKPVMDCLQDFSGWYASAHRGSGFKSLISTHLYEKSRQKVAAFVGADPSQHTLIFVQNATHALNKLARRLKPGPDEVVITTRMEHHSNLLPWNNLSCKVEHVRVDHKDGMLDMKDMEKKIRQNSDRLALVSVCGASNVTGNMPPLRRIARLTHQHNALMAADVTQLVPHRGFKMGDPNDPERVDFAVFSAHKMYCPFGSGALIGPRKIFQQGVPDMVGGGTVDAVTLKQTMWADTPQRDEAGTPNMLGALGLATATALLEQLDMEEVAEHERMLTRHLLKKLCRLDRITVYGHTDTQLQPDRIGVVTFNIDGMVHGRVAAALGYEWGIGVRSGCFCAQPYIRDLLDISDEKMAEAVEKLRQGDHSTIPGMVRASFGIYNTKEEVDILAEALQRLTIDGPKETYILDDTGYFVPEQRHDNLNMYSPF